MPSRLLRVLFAAVLCSNFLVAQTSLAQEPAPSDQAQDVCFWQTVPYAELSPDQRALWAVLGWNEANWDSEDETAYPPSETKTWDELSPEEQKAASGLGYTQESWDNIEEICSAD
jgi:hypothetical protein